MEENMVSKNNPPSLDELILEASRRTDDSLIPWWVMLCFFAAGVGVGTIGLVLLSQGDAALFEPVPTILCWAVVVVYGWRMLLELYRTFRDRRRSVD